MGDSFAVSDFFKLHTMSDCKLHTDKNEIISLLSKCESNTRLFPVLIGSRAMKQYIEKRKITDKTDYDFVASASYVAKLLKETSVDYLHLKEWPHYLKVKIIVKGQHVELEIALKDSSNYDLIEWCHDNYDVSELKHLSIGAFSFIYHVAPLHLLERIKTSHIYQPVNWNKHIEDLHMMREILPFKTSENYYQVYAKDQPTHLPTNKDLILEMLSFEDRFMIKRRREFNKIFGIPGEHISLNMSNEEFLDEAKLTIPIFIVHDDLHELVKYNDVPIQNMIRRDLSSAMCDMTLFKGLSMEYRLQCGCEERDVLALERRLLPGIFTDENEARDYAMFRMCTTVTKGEFRGFLVDNWHKIKKMIRPLKPFHDEVMRRYNLKHGIIPTIETKKEIETKVDIKDAKDDAKEVKVEALNEIKELKRVEANDDDESKGDDDNDNNSNDEEESKSDDDDEEDDDFKRVKKIAELYGGARHGDSDDSLNCQCYRDSLNSCGYRDTICKWCSKPIPYSYSRLIPIRHE